MSQFVATGTHLDRALRAIELAKRDWNNNITASTVRRKVKEAQAQLELAMQGLDAHCGD